MTIRPTYQDILARLQKRIADETSLDPYKESSAIGLILRMTAAEIDQAWGYIEELERQTNLRTASGGGLDNFGLYLGTPRNDSRKSTTLGLQRSIKFTNIGGAGVNVPAGTRVFKSTDPSLAYFTTEGVLISAGSSETVHAIAADLGDLYNIGVGELDSHSVPNAALTVTNILPIENGSNRESDASYRERLLQEFSRRTVLNPSNTVALMRNIPGVRDAYLLNNYRGAGTFDIIIIPHAYNDTSALVSKAQTILNSSVPIGISAKAKGPTYRQLDIIVKLRFKASATNKEATRENLRQQIIAIIDNLPVEDGSGNGSFAVDQIYGNAIAASGNIISANVTLRIDERALANSGMISLGVGERLVIRTLVVE